MWYNSNHIAAVTLYIPKWEIWTKGETYTKDLMETSQTHIMAAKQYSSTTIYHYDGTK